MASSLPVAKAFRVSVSNAAAWSVAMRVRARSARTRGRLRKCLIEVLESGRAQMPGALRRRLAVPCVAQKWLGKSFSENADVVRCRPAPIASRRSAHTRRYGGPPRRPRSAMRPHGIPSHRQANPRPAHGGRSSVRSSGRERSGSPRRRACRWPSRHGFGDFNRARWATGRPGTAPSTRPARGGRGPVPRCRRTHLPARLRELGGR